MKDLGGLMKQAQAMQAKLADAQARIQELEVTGAAGDGLVKVVLRGTGELLRVDLDNSLMAPGEADMVADLIVVAHGDAKRQLDAKNAELMREAAGPLAGMPGMPKLF